MDLHLHAPVASEFEVWSPERFVNCLFSLSVRCSFEIPPYTQPYVETVDSAGREDSVVADESWKRYLMRNDSIMVDTCTVRT